MIWRERSIVHDHFSLILNKRFWGLKEELCNRLKNEKEAESMTHLSRSLSASIRRSGRGWSGGVGGRERGVGWFMRWEEEWRFIWKFDGFNRCFYRCFNGGCYDYVLAARCKALGTCLSGGFSGGFDGRDTGKRFAFGRRAELNFASFIWADWIWGCWKHGFSGHIQTFKFQNMEINQRTMKCFKILRILV